MKTNIMKKGFTLIELLVVITIIGILATGGISVYTTQIQKARDSGRITDIKTLQWAVEQAYQDNWNYPKAFYFLTGSILETWVKDYIEDIPGDVKTGQVCSDWTVLCWYMYKVQDDANNIEYWAFEMSTAFENQTNLKKFASNEVDWWGSEVTYEIWIEKPTIDSAFSWTTTVNVSVKWACLESLAGATSDTAAGNTVKIVINKDWDCS